MNKDIFEKALEGIKSNEACWLITVIASDGSTPGKIGMKMLVKLSGELLGTIGGGNIEQITVDRVLKDKPADPVRWCFDLDGNSDHEKIGMLCGGVQEVMVDPLSSQFNLTIVGGGHCGQALSELAARCGFSVTVIDDRSECSSEEKHPYATKLICSKHEDVEKHIQFSDKTYIVVMTHGHRGDEIILRQVLGQDYCYLGVIGSKNKTKSLFKILMDDGFSKEELKKVYAPIGLPIGSQTPMEVAVSIVSQLIAIRKGINKMQMNSNPLIL